MLQRTLFASLALLLVGSVAGCDTGPPPIPPLPDAAGLDSGTGPTSCTNSVRDGDETGIDCGGSCPGCADGDPCVMQTDCQSRVCMRGRCLIPTCTDGVRNGREIGTDCGGDCGLCPGGEPCTENAQCISGRCRGSVCSMSTCDDGRQNADETDVDCGGPLCPPCRGGETCATETDCTSYICEAGTCTEPACNDGVQNQDETSVDCGGGLCAPCRDGLACNVDVDCEGRRCIDGGCISCMDRVRNAEETDVDCGGGLCPACRDGLSCRLDTDCENSFCLEGTCVSCRDGERNFDETDVDCGGTRCAGCLNGRMCALGRDCLSSDCAAGMCRGRGDTCGDAITLTTGMNAVAWVATANDYLTANPACSSQPREGPDVVMQYTATVDGFLTFEIDKPTLNRWTMLISDQPCGMPTPSLVCQSRYTEATMAGELPIRAGTTYTFYIADTTLGTAPLSNPLNVRIQEIVPPCRAGVDGVVGDTITRLPSGLSFLTNYYLAPDASPTGFVYFGGTLEMYRIPKAGGTRESVNTLAGISSLRLGYVMAIAGNEIYSVETTTGTVGRLFRLSTDAGATWLTGGQDYGIFNEGATAPNDDFRGATADPTNSRLHLVTEAFSPRTEFWSVPLRSATAPVTGRLDGFITSHYQCSGLAMDATYYYTACAAPSPARLIRVHRTTMAVDVISSTARLDTLVNTVHAADTNTDGLADVLYVNGGTAQIYYACGLASGTPFAAPFVTWSDTDLSQGLGFDAAARRLYAFDRTTRDVLVIQ
ncbi:MAG: hypothetical protein KF729_35650 [Sandaracinaceae bacterium]|nr:hypothetical protein [Sandaracinaceae bacterium]